MDKASYALISAFPHLPNKELAWKDLLALAKNIHVQRNVGYILNSVFPHVTDKVQAWKDLQTLTKEDDIRVRFVGASTFVHLAGNHINMKEYNNAYQCYDQVASAIKYGFWEHIRPEPAFYLYKGLAFYYHGRALVSKLMEIQDPNKFIKDLRNITILFDKSIKNLEKFPYEHEFEVTFCPICLNVFSAYYEYNLLIKTLNAKRVIRIRNYLIDAYNQCEIINSEKGKKIVKIFEKLTESQESLINEIKLETEKRDASKKGKGVGEVGTINTFIKKSRKDFGKHINELDNLLNELEAPFIKKIIEFEKERFNEIKPEKEDILMPKTFWIQTYDYIINIVKKFWKIIATIGLILTIIVGIIKNWGFISDLLKF